MAAGIDGHRSGSFIVTKEHRRFIEFANAVRKYRYIGLCYGPAGIGKTLSARRYARWEAAEPLLKTWGPRQDSDAKVYVFLADTRSVFYTPTVGHAPREFRQELSKLMSRVEGCIGEHLRLPGQVVMPPHGTRIELVIVDEAERIADNSLEYIRDIFDREEIGLILIGMPGIEKRMSRYPQFYSRVGFAHQYRALQDEELSFVLTRRWRELGLTMDDADFTDTQAVASIVRITGGNFRLVHRLFIQIERILAINGMKAITDDAVEAARSTLVIGAA